MSTLDSIDWSAFPTIPLPDPGPNGVDADSWRPKDFDRGFGRTDYPAAPTLSRVEWLHNENTRAAYCKEDDRACEINGDWGAGVPDPWASIVYAYKALPPIPCDYTLGSPVACAIESIILGHIPFVCNVIKNWVRKVFGRNVTQSDDDLFGVALLKLAEIVPTLGKVGRENGWDDWEAPGRIASYLGKSVRNRLSYELNKRVEEHDGIPVYLLLKRCRPKRMLGLDLSVDNWHDLYAAVRPGPRQKTKEQKEKEKEKKKDKKNSQKTRSAAGKPPAYAAYDDRTPDRILQDREEWKSFSDVLDCACKDVLDRLLLTMKREGTLTETEMGELYGGKEHGLGRDAVHRRLDRMHRAMQEELGYDPKLCRKLRNKCNKKKSSKKGSEKKKGKRCSRKAEKRRLAEEVLASWRCPAKPATYVPAPHFPVSRDLPAGYMASLSANHDAVALARRLHAVPYRTPIPRYEDIVSSVSGLDGWRRYMAVPGIDKRR